MWRAEQIRKGSKYLSSWPTRLWTTPSCCVRAPRLVSLWGDVVRMSNLSFSFVLSFAVMWLVLMNVSVSVVCSLVLYPPCIGPPQTFTSQLIVVSIIKSPWIVEKGCLDIEPPNPFCVRSSHASVRFALSSEDWHVGTSDIWHNWCAQSKTLWY